MAKRKSKRFGSPPVTHIRRAGEDISAVRHYMQQTRKHLKSGNCVAALGSLTSAERWTGSAYAERNGAGKYGRKGVIGAGANAVLHKLTTKFISACLKPRR